MPRQVKSKNGEQPEPEPADFELNLAFASTKDLIDELVKRSEAMVIAYQLTDAMMESEPSEDNAKCKEGGRWTATMYTGSIPTCIGLAEIMKHDLLKEWD